jgi:hypothetical protein
MATEGQQATAPPAPSQLTPEREADAKSRLLKCLRLTARKRCPRERLGACLGNALWTRRVIKLAITRNLEKESGYRYRNAFKQLLPKPTTQPVLPPVNFQPTKSRLSKQVP